jgi:hypothetical protein
MNLTDNAEKNVRSELFDKYKRKVLISTLLSYACCWGLMVWLGTWKVFTAMMVINVLSFCGLYYFAHKTNISVNMRRGGHGLTNPTMALWGIVTVTCWVMVKVDYHVEESLAILLVSTINTLMAYIPINKNGRDVIGEVFNLDESHS